MFCDLALENRQFSNQNKWGLGENLLKARVYTENTSDVCGILHGIPHKSECS